MQRAPPGVWPRRPRDAEASPASSGLSCAGDRCAADCSSPGKPSHPRPPPTDKRTTLRLLQSLARIETSPQTYSTPKLQAAAGTGRFSQPGLGRTRLAARGIRGLARTIHVRAYALHDFLVPSGTRTLPPQFSLRQGWQFGGRFMRKIALLTAVVAASAVTQASQSTRSTPSGSSMRSPPLRIHHHLEHLQRIADEKRRQPRAWDCRAIARRSATSSIGMKKAHYNVTVQPFIANLFEETHACGARAHRRLTHATYVARYRFHDDDSIPALVTSQLRAASDQRHRTSSGPRFAAIDIQQRMRAGRLSGANVVGHSIVLIQRGTCTFEKKAENAAAAGAMGVDDLQRGPAGPARTSWAERSPTSSPSQSSARPSRSAKSSSASWQAARRDTASRRSTQRPRRSRPGTCLPRRRAK